jgi:hypothetical protein
VQTLVLFFPGVGPHVFVFSNPLPYRDALTSDRWVFYRLGTRMKMLHYMDDKQYLAFAMDYNKCHEDRDWWVSKGGFEDKETSKEDLEKLKTLHSNITRASY